MILRVQPRLEVLARARGVFKSGLVE